MLQSILIALALLLAINAIGFVAVILRQNRMEQILHRMRGSNDF
jgi:hypothetical protein